MHEIRFIEDVTVRSISSLIANIEQAREEEPDELIVLYVASGGGNPVAAITFYHYIMAKSVPIKTVAIGEVCSAAAIVFLAGKERVAVKDAHFLLHPLKRATFLNHLAYHLIYPILWPSVKREQDAHVKILNDQKERIYLQKTKFSQEDLEKIRHGFLWLKADEALEKGLIHEIVSSPGV